jgi:CubicO group peptidase (beta-lactamase class C family)
MGFAIQDGLLSLDDKVVKFFPEAVPANPDPRLLGMTVRDLAIMSSGFGKDYIGEMRAGMDDIAATTFSQPFKFDPGSRYEYNSTNTYLIGVIVSKLTGKALDEYLAAKLFKPLGIKDWAWEKSAEGYCFGGWGLYLSPESLAKAGQFLLQKGKWKGKQLLQASFIEEATTTQIAQYVPGTHSPSVEKIAPTSDWYQGYGYQFWTCTHGAYRMSGAYGQWVIVVPDKDAVIVLTSYTASGGQQLLNLIWDNVLPSL